MTEINTGITPFIVHNLQAHQFYKPNYIPKNEIEAKRVDESNFARAKGNFNWFDYIRRKASCDRAELQDVKHLNTLLEEQVNTSRNYFNYAGNRPGSTGLFDQYGDVSEEKLEHYKNIVQNTKSVIWTSIISFTPEYSEKYMNNKQQAYQTLKATLPILFAKAGLDPENINWTAAYHVNTDNRHCHINFWEKEKTKINVKGEKCFTKWKLPTDALESWKADISYFHKATPLDYLTLRDNVKESVSTLLQNNKSNLLEKLDLQLKNINSFQYARVTKNNQLAINNVVDKLINSDLTLKKVYDEYYKKLMTTQKEILKNCNEVKVKPTPAQKQFASSRISEFYNRCGNSVLKLLKEYRQTKQNTKLEKEEIRKEAIQTFKKQASANKRRIIYKTSIATRSRNLKISNIMQRMVVILATDVNREIESLDSWFKKEYYENEKDWKD